MLGGLALDLWSKYAVFRWLSEKPDYRVSVIDGILSLVTALNEGAAFGIASGKKFMLVSISGAAIVVIIGVFLLTSGRQRIVQIALGLFGAGVCGNLWDRVFNGGLVRDFIDVMYWPGRHWPSFNIADLLLCVAVGLLILATLTDRRSCQKHAQQQK
jgi:signal peptidase II